MSVLSVANVWFESSGANRIDYVNSTITVSGNIATPNIYVTGNVVTSNVVASNVIVNGTKISPFMSGFKNKIINGNFDIWQRSTSNTNNGYYAADRWASWNSGTTKTVSRQSFTVGQTDVPGEPKYYYRHVVTSSAGAGNYCVTSHYLEGVRSLAGQVATLSFWAKADSSKNIGVEIRQYFGSGGSPSSAVSTPLGLTGLTSSWQKFAITFTLPSISGKTIGSNDDDDVELAFWFDAGSTNATRASSVGQQSGTFDMAKVQLELGPVATEFDDRHISQEFLLCQRYYQEIENTAGAGYASGSGQGFPNDIRFATIMRAAPSITAGTFSTVNCSLSGYTDTGTYVITASSSGSGIMAWSSTSTPSIKLDAELS